MENTLYYGDNLDILRRDIKDENVDLIYLDPPFKSGKDYNILYKEGDGTKSAAQIKVFEDTWHWDRLAQTTFEEITEGEFPQKAKDLIIAFKHFLGENDMMAYLVMMTPRIQELHKVLKPTGSIYLHCDSTASHYLKLVMDSVFGKENFRNEIIWHYFLGGKAKRFFARKHDSIFFYNKSDRWIFNYREVERRLFKKPSLGSHKEIVERNGSWYSKVGMDDVWDIPGVFNLSKEHLGYPTQKPEALLERIIKASSNEGDIVLDPFCGCGTTIGVAEKLKRKWIGIDITHLAITLIKRRLKDTFGDETKYKIIGEPVDLQGAAELAEQNRYQFQWWALGLVGARPIKSEQKKGTDRGKDGYIYFYDDLKRKEVKKIIIQVKSGHAKVSDIRDLRGVIEREKAQIGVFITLQKPTKPMKTEAVSSGYYKSPLGHKYPKIQILTIKELLKE